MLLDTGVFDHFELSAQLVEHGLCFSEFFFSFCAFVKEGGNDLFVLVDKNIIVFPVPGDLHLQIVIQIF